MDAGEIWPSEDEVAMADNEAPRGVDEGNEDEVSICVNSDGNVRVLANQVSDYTLQP